MGQRGHRPPGPDLRREFPEYDGLLAVEPPLHARALPTRGPREGDDSIVQQPVGQLPWGQNIALLTSSKTASPPLVRHARLSRMGGRARFWRPRSRPTSRAPGGALTSFEHALPEPDSELVRDAIKDPYNFEFLGLSARAKERDLELALLNDVQSFLMEMGRGFALVGRQFPLRVLDEETGEEAGVLHRPPVLQLPSPALRRDRPEGRGLQA